MTPKLTKAVYLDRYKIRVCYEDGTVGVVDLEGELWGEVFEPLKDRLLFQSFKIDPDLQTLVWPTGADLAPEFLYAQASL